MRKKGKSGTAKYGRNKAKCEQYRRLKKHEKSHLRRITKHIITYNDHSKMARKALIKYQDLLKQQ